jgi:hypothetical protein
VFTTTILMIAMMGQASEAPLPTQAVRAPMPPARMTQRERIAAKKAALRRQNAMRERGEYLAELKAQKDAQAAYERALPFMLEAQRQAIQRQGDIERNAALHRMAGAAEAEAQTYQWDVYSRPRR